ncbi:MAG TPA: NADH-quinone oxidoreductase subunit L [Nitrososphaerales archaeon]|nr:NADH-quinone oxidoreductase subunit L [Nitrososphaerales archaeon]
MIYWAWLSWVIPLLGVPLVPLVSRIDGRLRGWLAVVFSGLGMVAAIYGATTFGTSVTEGYTLWLPQLNVMLQVKVDQLSALVGAFVSFVSFLVVVYSLGYMKEEPGQSRYYSLVLLFVGSMMGLVMAGNLIQFYFFWELVGVCSALLIAFWTDRPAARKAGWKAFVVTRLGDASLLIAVIFIAVTFGSTSFDTILGPNGIPTLATGTIFALGLLMFIGSMGKSAQVPLHAWLPDAMEGPNTVSALIHAATMVNAGVYLMLRMYPVITLPQLSGSLTDVILAIGLLSALVGGACAFAADDLKRVLAYSTISQLGLMFAAIGLGNLAAAAYQMISQGLFKALAFLAAGSVITALGTRSINEMGGLARIMKYTYAGFLIAMLGMSGLPPLVGFWSKDAILSSAFTAGALQSLLVLCVFTFTALYSFRALLRVFHGKPGWTKAPKESPPTMVVPILVLALSVLVAWAILQAQPLLSSVSWVPSAATLATSLTVLGLCAGIAYFAFLQDYQRVLGVIQSNRGLLGLRGFLHEGLGFDRLYQWVYSGVMRPLSRAVSYIQTGLIRANMALLLLAAAVLFVLFAMGVL